MVFMGWLWKCVSQQIMSSRKERAHLRAEMRVKIAQQNKVDKYHSLNYRFFCVLYFLTTDNYFHQHNIFTFFSPFLFYSNGELPSEALLPLHNIPICVYTHKKFKLIDRGRFIISYAFLIKFDFILFLNAFGSWQLLEWRLGKKEKLKH